ncbi:choice-of-anchor I family protein [Actinomycetota bacterium]
MAEQTEDKTAPGSVSLFDARDLTLVKRLTVGALPDMVTITANGSYALVANEGEPDGYCEGMVDPEGSVSVIDLRGGAAKATVATADFRGWIGKEDALRADGVRIFGPGSNAAQDIEPEYITVDHTGKTAYVTLQENNAVAVVDITSATVTRILPLGLQDHSVAGSGLDASDKGDKVNIATWPVKGMYLPDGIASFKAKAATYLVTANEGDARDWDCFSEEQRIADVTLDPTAFPNDEELQGKKALGRLNISTTSPVNATGEVTELHAFGGRSVSIRDAATGALVWDSGDAFEQLTAKVRPELFNADHAENDSFDSRSDNKGPEPEGVDVGRIKGATYAFVGLERNSGIVAVDVTDPSAGRIAGYGINRDSAGDPEAGTAGDLGPEGIHFVSAGESPNGKPLLLVGNEVSGTTTIWQIGTSR